MDSTSIQGCALELDDDSDATLTTRVHRELVNRVYVVGKQPGLNALRIGPALTIDPKEIERALMTLEHLLA